MSRFQSTVSTFAALSTIAVTAVTAYKVFDNQQQNNARQQLIIEDLKKQLSEKNQQSITPIFQSQIQPISPPPPIELPNNEPY